jgi:hypothetical protein
MDRVSFIEIIYKKSKEINELIQTTFKTLLFSWTPLGLRYHPLSSFDILCEYDIFLSVSWKCKASISSSWSGKIRFECISLPYPPLPIRPTFLSSHESCLFCSWTPWPPSLIPLNLRRAMKSISWIPLCVSECMLALLFHSFLECFLYRFEVMSCEIFCFYHSLLFVVSWNALIESNLRLRSLTSLTFLILTLSFFHDMPNFVKSFFGQSHVGFQGCFGGPQYECKAELHCLATMRHNFDENSRVLKHNCLWIDWN